MFMFHGHYRNLAVMTPVKYDCDPKNLNFGKIKDVPPEKFKNNDSVTPPMVSVGFRELFIHPALINKNWVHRLINSYWSIMCLLWNVCTEVIPLPPFSHSHKRGEWWL